MTSRTTQGIEGAVNIGNRLNAHGGEHLNEPQLQPIRRDLPYSKAKPYRLAQGIQHLLGEGLFELTHHAAQILVLHRLLPDRVIKSSSFAVNLNIDRATRTIIGIRT